jgi:hypothetical protein
MLAESNFWQSSLFSAFCPKSTFGSWAPVLPPFQKIKKIIVLSFKNYENKLGHSQ